MGQIQKKLKAMFKKEQEHRIQEVSAAEVANTVRTANVILGKVCNPAVANSNHATNCTVHS